MMNGDAVKVAADGKDAKDDEGVAEVAAEKAVGVGAEVAEDGEDAAEVGADDAEGVDAAEEVC
jgi:hypothetical protein